MPAESFKTSSSDDPASEAIVSREKSKQRVMRDVALLLARHEVRNLRRWLEEFDRDILLPILLGEIALHNISPVAQPNETSELDEECVLKPCNAYSIAAATGLPRETVRRKVLRLVELGWVRRRNNGHLYVSSDALKHFGQLLNSRELSEIIETAERARHMIGAAEGE